ncbi:MAG: glycine zipper 2TM domain-containing protein [Burkholderiales bacterium]
MQPVDGGVWVAGSARRWPKAWIAGGVLALCGVAAAAFFAGRSSDRLSGPAVAEPVAAVTENSRHPAAANASPVEKPAAGKAAVACASCGVVESVQAVQRKGVGSGLGAVAGGVVGGALGSQVGRGDGRTAMTVLGAIGGGLAGNEVEKRAKAVTLYRVRIKMDNGEVRTIEQGRSEALGQRVRIEGQKLRPVSEGV